MANEMLSLYPMLSKAHAQGIIMESPMNIASVRQHLAENGQNYQSRVEVDMPLPFEVTAVPLATEQIMPPYYSLRTATVDIHSHCAVVFHSSMFVNWDCFDCFNGVLLAVDTDENAKLITPISDTFSEWFRQNVT